MPTLTRKIIRDLSRRKLRSFLTLLGVLLGVAGVVAISSTTRTLADAQRLTYDAGNQADLVTFSGTLGPTVLNLIERQENVQTVDARSVTITRFSAGDGWRNLRLVGIDDFAGMKLDVADLVEGRFPNDGEIAFDESARSLANLEIGDLVAIRRSTADPVVELRISGFTRSPSVLDAGILNQAVGYTTGPGVREMTGRSGQNYLLVRVHDRDRASETGQAISGLLNKRGVWTSGLTVRDPDNFIGSSELETLLLLLRIFSVLGACLASFIVANTLSAIMIQEAGQIGVLKSLGGRSWQLLGTYLLYSVGLGIAGAVGGLAAGIASGWVLSSYLTGLTGLRRPELSIAAADIGLALLVGLAVTVAATLYPVVRYANQPALPLLRSQGVQNDLRSQWLARLTRPLSSRLSTVGAIGLRNALRRPGRSIATIFIVAVAAAAFVSTQALSSSVSGTVDELYELYGADGWVYFGREANIALAREIGQDPSVLDVEPWTSASAAVGSVRTDVWGMPTSDPLYDYRLVEGTWIGQSNPPSVVVTSNLARTLDATVGKGIEIDIGERRHSVVVTGIVDDSSTYLGNTATGKVFMPVEDLNRILGLGQRADLFALKFRSSDPAYVDAALTRLEERYADLAPGSLAAHTDQASAQQAIGVLTTLLNAMVVVVAVVGLAGIVNTLLITVTERRREFGILRAVGGQSWQVTTTVISEGVTLAGIGLGFGIAFGYPLSHWLVELTGRQLFELTFMLPLSSLAVMFLVALLAVAAVATAPGLLASRIRPINVLRYE
jgi:putative ABC transport system permease protein